MNTKKLVSGYGEILPKKLSLRDSGTAINIYRKASGLTMDDIGHSIGMTKAQICKLEKNGNPTAETINRIFRSMHSEVYLDIEPIISGDRDNVLAELVYSVSEYAKRHDLSDRQAYNYLERFGGIAFFLQHSEVELSTSMQDTLDDLDAICRKNGGAL